jgi:hypothetical protein
MTLMLAELTAQDILLIIAGVTTALVTVLGAVGTFVVTVKTSHKVDTAKATASSAVAANTKAVADVHTLVNANLTAATVRNEQLTAALTEHGIAVPEPPEPIIPPAAPVAIVVLPAGTESPFEESEPDPSTRDPLTP